MHAREMVFVLDVSEDDNARLQGYAYHEMTHDDGTTVETGTVEALPTELGSHLLKDLVRAGTLPVVMILRYRSTGNHYQAITYDQARFTEYCKKLGGAGGVTKRRTKTVRRQFTRSTPI